jgi:hypothetical protein
VVHLVVRLLALPNSRLFGSDMVAAFKRDTPGMPDRTRSDKWDGFSPTGYVIDWKVLSGKALKEVTEQNRRTTSVLELLQEVMPHRFFPLDENGKMTAAPARQSCKVQSHGAGGISLETPQRKIAIDTLTDGTSFPAAILETLVRIDQASSDDEFHPVFFYYDHDQVIDDVHDSFSFFVCNDGQIVLDRVTFSRHGSSGFDPDVFTPAFKTSTTVWLNEGSIAEAQVRWWYRKFYEETDAGRLTLLRDDAEIFHYESEWKQRAQVTYMMRELTARLSKIERLMWLLLICLALLLVLR